MGRYSAAERPVKQFFRMTKKKKTKYYRYDEWETRVRGKYKTFYPLYEHTFARAGDEGTHAWQSRAPVAAELTVLASGAAFRLIGWRAAGCLAAASAVAVTADGGGARGRKRRLRRVPVPPGSVAKDRGTKWPCAVCPLSNKTLGRYLYIVIVYCTCCNLRTGEKITGSVSQPLY